MKSIVLINCYFGSFPNYFNLFLDSCRSNDTIDFLFFTDNLCEEYDIPSNVRLVYTTFEELKIRIQSKFDFKISLDAPYKLCDYKVAYGYIFNDYISKYDFWGYCDVDLIFGRLRHFLTEEVLDNYDKIYKLGHLTIIRNTDELNSLFMIDDYVSYKKVFSTSKIMVFDEYQGIQIIFDQMGKKTYFSRDYADITPMKYKFSLSNLLTSNIDNNNYKNQIFVSENNCIYRYYEMNGLIKNEEFAYIHLQRRKFVENRIEDHRYLITNTGFIPYGDKVIDKRCMEKYNGEHFFKELRTIAKNRLYKIKRKISKVRVDIYEYSTSTTDW